MLKFTGEAADIGKLAASLAKAQAAMQNAAKGRRNTYEKYNYADLGAVRDAVVPHLAAQGLAVMQDATQAEDGVITVETFLVHGETGAMASSTLSAKAYRKPALGERTTERAIGDDPQTVGGTVTYLRRYGLQALVCAASEEDEDLDAGKGEQASSSRRGGADGGRGATATAAEEERVASKELEWMVAMRKAAGDQATLDKLAAEIKAAGVGGPRRARLVAAWEAASRPLENKPAEKGSEQPPLVGPNGKEVPL